MQLKSLLLLALSAGVLSACGGTAPSTPQAGAVSGGAGGILSAAPDLRVSAPHADHQVIVSYQDGAALQKAAAKLGARVAFDLPALHAALLTLPDKMGVGQALFSLRGTGGVTSVQPNWRRSLPTLKRAGDALKEARVRAQDLATGLTDPTKAPFFAQQWALKDPPDGLNLVKAWPQLPGGKGAYTGTDGKRKRVVLAYFAEPLAPLPDFAGQVVGGFDFTAWACGSYPNSFVSVYTGEGVATSCNLGGQTGGGVVFDSKNIAPNVLPGVNYTTPDNSGFEAGLDASNMAANGAGVVGAAYDAQIIPLVVFSQNNPYAPNGGAIFEGDFAYAAEIVWAVDHGATILNNSLGGAQASPIINAGVNYALARDVMFVAASGDNGDALASQPADVPGVTAVTGTDQNGNLTYLSQIAPYVKYGAPGDNVIAAEAADFTACDPKLPACPLGVAAVPGYYYVGGTSSSSPYVVGVAALLQGAYQQKFHKFMTPGQVEAVLTQTGRKPPAGTQNFTNSFVIPDASAAVAYVNKLGTELADPSGAMQINVVNSQGQPVLDADVILRSPAHTYYAKSGYGGLGQLAGVDDSGAAPFLNIAPGSYSVLIGGPETIFDGDFNGTGNVADRLTQSGTVTVAVGAPATSTFKMPATTFKVTLTVSDPNLKLAVAEPDSAPGNGVVAGFVTPGNGTLGSGSFGGAGATQTYTLAATYAPGPYIFAVYTGNLAAGASANASVQVTENGKDLGTVKLANLTRGSTNVSLTGIVVPGNGQATALSLKAR